MKHAKRVHLTGAPADIDVPSGSRRNATDDSNAEPAPAVEVWTDGACKGNPGPGGWGAWLRAGAHEKELFG